MSVPRSITRRRLRRILSRPAVVANLVAGLGLVISLGLAGCSSPPSRPADAADAVGTAAKVPSVPPQRAVDWRYQIPAAEFAVTAPGEWTSAWLEAAFPFLELVYAWHQRPGDTFRILLQVRFAPGDESPWLYAGFWGDVPDLTPGRQRPVFDRGTLDMDWLKLTTRARSFRFKVVSAGPTRLVAPPAVSGLVTDPQGGDAPSDGLRRSLVKPAPPARVLDVPLRRQFDSQGRRMMDRCQSAALASALQYYGRTVPLEAITRFTFDPEYGYPGIWPRVIGAAQELGFHGRLERFRDWDSVRRALAANEILLCSMRLRAGECAAPPYPSMGNHIVALCGLTDDGRVVVTDSFLGRSGRGYLCQWRQEDFAKVWMENKGGLAMVIEPPAGAAEHSVKSLPPFPETRPGAVGDDH